MLMKFPSGLNGVLMINQEVLDGFWPHFVPPKKRGLNGFDGFRWHDMTLSVLRHTSSIPNGVVAEALAESRGKIPTGCFVAYIFNPCSQFLWPRTHVEYLAKKISIFSRLITRISLLSKKKGPSCCICKENCGIFRQDPGTAPKQLHLVANTSPMVALHLPKSWGDVKENRKKCYDVEGNAFCKSVCFPWFIPLFPRHCLFMHNSEKLELHFS